MDYLLAQNQDLTDRLAAAEAKVAALTADLKRKLPEEDEESDVVPSKKQLLRAMQTVEDGVVPMSSVAVCPPMPVQASGESVAAFLGRIEAYQADWMGVVGRCKETIGSRAKLDRAMKAEFLLIVLSRKTCLYYYTALELLPELLFFTVEDLGLIKRLQGSSEESPVYLDKLVKNIRRFAYYFRLELQDPMWLAAVNAVVSSTQETLRMFCKFLSYDLGPLAAVDENLYRVLTSDASP